ncbi:MAG TPA: hypothetical protein VM582_10565, partial [Candidatus Thermoplasmatota archaeon]|nr:hypothetical protein [Candidatus Thermoplasmatota archaeon]
LLRRALAFAKERGARVVGLDATPEARPLYEAEGFRPAWGESALWTRAPDAPRGGPPRSPSGEHAIYPVSPAEIMELVQYDAPRFGAGRGRYLAALMGERPHQAFVAVHRKTGAFAGHALAHEGRVGPLVADTPAAAEWLLHALGSAGAAPRAIVPAWNADAERVFAAAGYAKGRPHVRMALGGPLPGRPETAYALGAWALG